MQAAQAEKRNDTAPGAAGESPAPESGRARVRRCLIAPLERDGFRRAAKVTAEAHAATLDRLAAELAHLTEAELGTLRAALEDKGQGRRRDEWPSLATVRAYASVVRPRPLQDLPEVLRWFRSVEGPRARAAGTLVEQWGYWERHRRPPLHEAARRKLAEDAAENRRRLVVVAEREAQGRADAADLAWRDWYRAEEARIAALVEARADV